MVPFHILQSRALVWPPAWELTVACRREPRTVTPLLRCLNSLLYYPPAAVTGGTGEIAGALTILHVVESTKQVITWALV